MCQLDYDKNPKGECVKRQSIIVDLFPDGAKGLSTN